MSSQRDLSSAILEFRETESRRTLDRQLTQRQVSAVNEKSLFGNLQRLSTKPKFR